MKIFTTAPPSVRFKSGNYLDELNALADAGTINGITGCLIYTDNKLADPWSIAQALLSRRGSEFTPLVAVQPIYMSPYAAARKVSTLAFLYGKKININMVSGNSEETLRQLGDEQTPTTRYERLKEYLLIMMALLKGETVSFEGGHYRLKNIALSPQIPEELMPDVFISGASQDAIHLCSELGAILLNYTFPSNNPPSEQTTQKLSRALRLGIIARHDKYEAWKVAHQYFPEGSNGQLSRKIKVVDNYSVWQRELNLTEENDVVWLHPLKANHTFCPYLVGSYREVARFVAQYVGSISAMVLDTPLDRSELEHTMTALNEMSAITN